MTKYAYRIQGALENAEGKFCGFRVLVCNKDFFELADVPAEVFHKETSAYIQFRLKVTNKFDVRKLPPTVENSIRVPLGRWLDRWVLKNFNGSISTNKNTNP
jgi:hypothetical protein